MFRENDFFVDITKELAQEGILEIGILLENVDVSKDEGIKFDVSGADGSIEIQFLEDCEFVSEDEIICHNFNRSINQNSNMKIFENLSSVDITNAIVLRDSYAGQNRVSGSINRPNYILLNNNKKYLLRIINKANRTNNIDININVNEK